jgi:hypothetical protein
VRIVAFVKKKMTFGAQAIKFLCVAVVLAFSLVSILLLGFAAIFFVVTHQSLCVCSESSDPLYLHQWFLIFVGLVCTLPFVIAMWLVKQWDAFMAKPRSTDESLSTPRSVLQSLGRHSQ